MKFIKSIFSRGVIISLLILSQIIAFCAIVTMFASQYFYFAIIVDVLSIFILMEFVIAESNPNYKIPWIIVILLIPPVGLIIYLMFGKGYVSRKHRRLHQSASDRQKEYCNKDETVFNELLNVDRKYALQSDYIYNTSKTPLYKNRKVDYFSSGREYFDKLLNDIKEAKKFVFLEYFILGKGKLLSELIEILKVKAEEGLDIRVIYDDIGSIKVLPYDFDKKLNNMGIKCIKFNKYYPFASVVYNNRDHRKIAVIDGNIAYTGGINISDEYVNYIERFGYWKDNGIRICGEAAKSFTLMFLKTYDVYSDTKTKFSDYLPEFSFEENDYDGYIQPFGDGPAPIYDNYIGENIYLNMINQATKYIYITTPYLIVDHLLMNALESAAKRGVDVRIITPGIPDKKTIYSLTRSSYSFLIKAGVKIYEYQPGFIHAKTVIVDDESCVVGTINFDYRSLVHHFECGCFMVKCSCIEKIKNDFLDTLEQSKMPNKKVYKTKNIFKRIWIGILKFFSPLL